MKARRVVLGWMVLGALALTASVGGCAGGAEKGDPGGGGKPVANRTDGGGGTATEDTDRGGVTGTPRSNRGRDAGDAGEDLGVNCTAEEIDAGECLGDAGPEDIDTFSFRAKLRAVP